MASRTVAQKSTGEIYDQHQRMFRGLMRLAMRRAALAHPETGGSEHLTHNWGNAEAKAVWRETWERVAKVRAVFDRLYQEAEHRKHGPDYGYLWCAACVAREASHA